VSRVPDHRTPNTVEGDAGQRSGCIKGMLGGDLEIRAGHDEEADATGTRGSVIGVAARPDDPGGHHHLVDVGGGQHRRFLPEKPPAPSPRSAVAVTSPPANGSDDRPGPANQ